jgi:hypothetical protein
MKEILHDQETETGHERRSQSGEGPAEIDEMLRCVEEKDFDRAARPHEVAQLGPGDPEIGIERADVPLEVGLEVVPAAQRDQILADVVAAPDELIVAVKRRREAGVAQSRGEMESAQAEPRPDFDHRSGSGIATRRQPVEVAALGFGHHPRHGRQGGKRHLHEVRASRRRALGESRALFRREIPGGHGRLIIPQVARRRNHSNVNSNTLPGRVIEFPILWNRRWPWCACVRPEMERAGGR